MEKIYWKFLLYTPAFEQLLSCFHCLMMKCLVRSFIDYCYYGNHKVA